jgi:amino acid adenylation domain-containing protein
MRRHLTDYLVSSAARFPDRPALVEADGCSITYSLLDRQADALAGFLASNGVHRGDRVVVALPKSIQSVVSLFGVLKSAAVYVPVDASAPTERILRIMTDCQPRALIVDGRCLGILSPDNHPDVRLHVVIVVGAMQPSMSLGVAMTGYEAALNAGGPPPPPIRAGEDLAYIIHTSGSTGVPKGAMITHNNALSFVEWCTCVLEPTEHDRFSSHTPFHFDASAQDIYPAIKQGAALHLIPEALAGNPQALAQFIEDHRLTIWTSTPTTLIRLVQFGSLESHGRTSVRLVSFGGEVFPIKHLRELQRRWPSAVYYNMYGPTETTTTCTFFRVPSTIPVDRLTPYPIGLPCAHCRAMVLDEFGREVLEGQEGLLYIAGPSVFAGYWNRPAETAAAFLDREGVRWYDTGDIVRWNSVDGFTYVGRKDRMVKRRGYRIELGEIEHVLSLHPLVREAAAVAVSDSEAGVMIVAFLSCTDAPPPTLVEMKTFCIGKLPVYMSPDRFVTLPILPKTSTDKIDYQALMKWESIDAVPSVR